MAPACESSLLPWLCHCSITMHDRASRRAGLLRRRARADIVRKLQRRFAELQETVWWSGGDANFYGDEVCAAVAANQGFFAPYRETPEWPPTS
jgi:hypothetical protein